MDFEKSKGAGPALELRSKPCHSVSLESSFRTYVGQLKKGREREV